MCSNDRRLAMKRARHLGRRSLWSDNNSHFGRSAALALSGVRTTCGQGLRAFDCCRDKARQDKCKIISAYGVTELCVSTVRQVSHSLISRVYQCVGTSMGTKIVCSYIEVHCMGAPPGAIWPQTTDPRGLGVSESKFVDTSVLAIKMSQTSHQCLRKEDARVLISVGEIWCQQVQGQGALLVSRLILHPPWGACRTLSSFANSSVCGRAIAMSADLEDSVSFDDILGRCLIL